MIATFVDAPLSRWIVTDRRCS